METTSNQINLTINDQRQNLEVGNEENLLEALRSAGYFSVKSGCDDGSCGVCMVLLNGKPTLSCKIKAVDADGS